MTAKITTGFAAVAIAIAAAFTAASGRAEGNAAREAFLKRQAYDEMVRISGQVDVLQTNIAELTARLARLENDSGAKAELDALKAEVAALRSTNAELRNRINSLHDEIVRDLTRKISQMQKELAPPPPPPQAAPRSIGPHREYTVQGGDTLSLIAAAFKTSVSKIKEMNNLKNDNIRVGQKLKLPL